MLVSITFQKAIKEFYFYIKAALTGLRPAIVGLIAAAALMLADKGNFVDYKSVIIFLVSFLLILQWKLHPIIMILIAGVAGLVLY